MDLGTFLVNQVIIHQIPKVKKAEKASSSPELSDIETPLTTALRTYLRERIGESFAKQQFDAVYDPPKPVPTADGEEPVPPPAASPVPQLVVDYFASNGSSFVEASQDMARHLFDMQTGVSSAGMLVLIDGTIGSGKAAGKCLAVLKLEMSDALAIKPLVQDGKATFEAEVRDITLDRKAQVFKAALFRRAEDLSKLSPVVSDNQKDTKKWGSEVADFFLKFLGCRLKETPERATKQYLEYVDEFVKSLTDPDEAKKVLTTAVVDLGSNPEIVNPKEYAETHLSPELQDKFLAGLRNQDGSVQSFVKDTSLINPRLKKVVAEFDRGIKVTGPAQAMSDSVVRGPDGNWEIKAELQQWATGSTR